MPIDWEKFNRDVDEIIAGAAERTDRKLAAKIASVSRMNEEEITELFPAAADAKLLANLLAVVKSAEDRNTKINNILSNAEEFAGVILTLLTKFA